MVTTGAPKFKKYTVHLLITAKPKKSKKQSKNYQCMKGIIINDSKCYSLRHFFVIDNLQIQENKVPMHKMLGLFKFEKNSALRHMMC